MRAPIALVALLAAAGLALGGCGGASDQKASGTSASTASAPQATLSLVAYSTPEQVYNQIIPAFRGTPQGSGIDFRTSFGPSGDQSRAVDAGLPADVVSFSTEPDMTRLVRDGIVAADWNAGPNHGRVTSSLVTFLVRKGNPKNIHTWADLLRPGIQVLTPNPLSSGGAKWNLLAAYGQAAQGGRNPQAGLDYVRQLITDHAKVQDKSGQESVQNFLRGNGDVALTYQEEGTSAQTSRNDVEVIVPNDTIQIDINIATTKKAPPAATAFLGYALSQPAQQKFATAGYRPVNQEVLAANKAEFPDPSGLFTIQQLGGWSKVDKDLFDPANGSITRIESGAGLSAGK